MDLQMPVMDGFEATRLIRANPRWADLPVIAMTAAALPRDRDACQAAGMNDFIGKPVLVDALIRVLSQWIKPREPSNKTERSMVEAARSIQRPDRESDHDVAFPKDLPGFAVGQAMQMLCGNQAMLRHLIVGFCAQFADSRAELDAHLAAGDFAAAAALLHQIKGAAGNLAAVRLLSAAEGLEAEILDSHATDRLLNLEEFYQALAEVLTTQARLVEDEYNCAKCDWQRSQSVFQTLQELLDANDYVPPELLTDLSRYLTCQPVRTKLKRLIQYVEAADYPRALAILNDIACREDHPQRR
jgi:two-component system, sensor histidine kinase and response regulator